MTEKYIVPEDKAGERLDKFLAAETGLSRSYIQTLIDNPAKKIKSGEEYSLTIPQNEELDLTPWDYPLDIVYEDKNLVVINKPVGMTVHPAAGNYTHTLVHALLHHCKGQLSGINGVERPGIVHRLDKDTSGLIVVAKTDVAHKELAKQIEERECKRQYLAVVCGMPNPSSGIIRTGFGRHPVDRKKMTTYDLTETVYSTGGSSRHVGYNEKGEIEVGHNTEFGMERGEGRKSKIAITEYKVKEVYQAGKACLIECKLQTGRTHQIRVHMKHINCPIIGDQVYGSRKGEKKLPDFERQALHAYKLTIQDVCGSGKLELEAPIPPDMSELIENLK